MSSAEPQSAVARARAEVLSGRGPGADPAEVARATRERPTLGPYPAPLERELVHLHTARIRSDAADDLMAARMRNQAERVREVWGAPGAAPPTGFGRFRHPASACVAALVAAMAAAEWVRRRRRTPHDHARRH